MMLPPERKAFRYKNPREKKMIKTKANIKGNSSM